MSQFEDGPDKKKQKVVNIGDKWDEMGQAWADEEIKKIEAGLDHEIEEGIETLLRKAKVAEQNKKYDLARSYYQEALKLNPDSFEALVDFGVFLLRRKEAPEERRYFEKAAELRPKSILPWINLAATCSS